MELHDVLDNLVCRNYLLSFLQVNDLLRLRRVCRSIQDTTEDFIRTQKVETGRVLLLNLNGDDKNPFENFQQFQDSLAHLPIRTSVHLKLPDEQMNPRLFEVPLQHLLGPYTTKITHLTITNLDIPISSESVLEFFESLTNIASLNLCEITGRDLRFEDEEESEEEQEKMESEEEEEKESVEGEEEEKESVEGEEEEKEDEEELEEAAAAAWKEFKIPSTFKSLNTLTITEGRNFWRSSPRFVFQLLETCLSNLKQLSILNSLYFDLNITDIPADLVNHIRQILFNAPNLKLKDIQGWLVELLTDDTLVAQPIASSDAMINSINSKVISICNPKMKSFLLELPNLEIIKIFNVFCCTIPDTGFLRRDWPNLKEIFAYCNEVNDEMYGPSPREVWDFLFVGIKRENVVKLNLMFASFDDDETFPASDIVTSCPNLKDLTIKGELEKLSALWSGLPHLEKLSLDCSNLGEVDLIGANKENPAFWSLKNLQELWFHNMKSTKLTDDLFDKVLSRMPLKKLYLCGDASNSQITGWDQVPALGNVCKYSGKIFD